MTNRARVFCDKAEDLLPRLPADSFDSIVCDPPYGLAELPTALVIKALTEWLAGNRLFVPDGKGFMSKDWDKFVPPPAVWDEAYRVLKPGGHLLAFAAPRTVGLMDISIRLAGFEVRDSLHWIYGSGFPKGLDVSKAIDKTRRRDYVAAAVRLGMEIPGRNLDDWTKEEHSPGDRWWAQFKVYLSAEDWQRLEREVTGSGQSGLASIAYARTASGEYDITAPATEDAARWQGWNVALKPAHEPIILARKPLSEGTVAANVLCWGTGALNVDGCKVGAETRTNNAGGASSLQRVSRVEQGYRPSVTASRNEDSEVAGRWPPNLLLTHSADCQAAGTRRVNGEGDYLVRMPETVAAYSCAPDCPVAGLDAQSGTLRARGNGTADKRAGLGYGSSSTGCIGEGPNPGDAGGASRFFPAFTWSPEYDLPFMYQAKAPKKERPRIVTDDGRVIQHPTVKPLALMRWLVRLVTPPGGTVGDFFTGTGPVVQAALDEGMRCVACDQDPDSVALSRVRLAPYAGVRFTVPEPVAEVPEEEVS